MEKATKKLEQRQHSEGSSNCVNNTKSLSRRNKALHCQLTIKCFLLIFVADLPQKLSTANMPSKEAASTVRRNDLLCNVGSDFECICNRSIGNLDNSGHLPCHKFIEGKQLEVVSMVMRDLNLKAMLHTNETYEQYLRRRIARILSQYCGNMPTECPEILADHPKSMSNLVEINNRTTAVIYDEPVFSRESVVILRVTFPPGKARTEIDFVAVKRNNNNRISPSTTLSPTTVKYILSAQIAPLSRVLGGIRIEQFGIEMIEKPKELVDNTKLLIMVGIIGISMAFCCTIAAIKQFCVLREASSRRMKGQNNLPSAAEEGKKSTRNYGTCTEKLFSNYDLSNGHVKSKSLCSRESMNSSKKTGKKAKKMSKCSSEVPMCTVLHDRKLAAEKQSPSPRDPYQNIFICDHSQLPKEGVDDEFEMEIQRIKRQNLHIRSPRSPFSSDDDATAASGFQGFHFPERLPIENAEKRYSISDNIPSVVLNDEQQNEASQSTNSGYEVNLSDQKECAFLGALSEDHPFARPLSRRGSVTEADQDEGEEGTLNDETRENTPDPLGDEQQQQQSAEREKPLILVLKRNREKEIESESESDEAVEEDEEEETDVEQEEEEEHGTLYQPLKEEEAWRDSSSEQQMANGKGGHKEKAEHLSSSQSEGNASAGTEKAVLDRHHYERLLESPGARTDAPKVRNNATPKIILNE